MTREKHLFESLFSKPSFSKKAKSELQSDWVKMRSLKLNLCEKRCGRRRITGWRRYSSDISGDPWIRLDITKQRWWRAKSKLFAERLKSFPKKRWLVQIIDPRTKRMNQNVFLKWKCSIEIYFWCCIDSTMATIWYACGEDHLQAVRVWTKADETFKSKGSLNNKPNEIPFGPSRANTRSQSYHMVANWWRWYSLSEWQHPDEPYM